MKTVIFDFDGTIADVLQLYAKFGNDLLVEMGYPPRDIEELQELRGMTVRQVLKRVDLPYHQLPTFALKGLQKVQKNMKNVEAKDGIVEVIKKLKKEYNLGIITSNTKGNLEYFLSRYKLEEYFDFVVSGVGLFGKSSKIKSALKKNKISKNEAIYIGDEVRDVEAAKSVGIKVAAVTWGLNNKEILQTYNPDYLIDKPKELLKVSL